jgi:hypothetical protein
MLQFTVNKTWSMFLLIDLLNSLRGVAVSLFIYTFLQSKSVVLFVHNYLCSPCIEIIYNPL